MLSLRRVDFQLSTIRQKIISVLHHKGLKIRQNYHMQNVGFLTTLVFSRRGSNAEKEIKIGGTREVTVC